MKTKDFRGVRVWQGVDELMVIVDLSKPRDAVALVEHKVRLEHGFSEPDPAEGVEQAFVVVIGDTPTILDLTKHVVNGHPGHSLRMERGRGILVWQQMGNCIDKHSQYLRLAISTIKIQKI